MGNIIWFCFQPSFECKSFPLCRDQCRDNVCLFQVTNYELGIVLPLKSEEEIEGIACWERPAKKYVIGKDEPWVSDDLKDRRGND